MCVCVCGIANCGYQKGNSICSPVWSPLSPVAFSGSLFVFSLSALTTLSLCSTDRLHLLSCLAPLRRPSPRNSISHHAPRPTLWFRLLAPRLIFKLKFSPSSKFPVTFHQLFSLPFKETILLRLLCVQVSSAWPFSVSASPPWQFRLPVSAVRPQPPGYSLFLNKYFHLQSEPPVVWVLSPKRYTTYDVRILTDIL